MAAATTRVATAVIRTRTERSEGLCIGDQPVADAAHGLKGSASERRVDLAPKVTDIYLDDVGVTAEVVTPHFVQQIELAAHIAWTTQERFEQIELARSQIDGYIT